MKNLVVIDVLESLGAAIIFESEERELLFPICDV